MGGHLDGRQIFPMFIQSDDTCVFRYGSTDFRGFGGHDGFGGLVAGTFDGFQFLDIEVPFGRHTFCVFRKTVFDPARHAMPDSDYRNLHGYVTLP